MDLALKILLCLFCVPLLGLGIKVMFKPSSMLDDLGLAPPGAVGLNSIRGMLGGLLLASVVMIVLGLVLQETVWFLAVAVVMGVAAVGRIVGIATDGFDKAVVRPLVVEIVVAVVAVAAHVRLG
jgi:hypothetical protein